VATVLWVNAGDLNPPPGPVASTMKTLSEVEPRIAVNSINTPGDADSLFKITQPGSYYLTGNITGVAETAQGVTQGAGETHRAAEGLAVLAGNLLEVVNRFHPAAADAHEPPAAKPTDPWGPNGGVHTNGDRVLVGSKSNP